MERAGASLVDYSNKLYSVTCNGISSEKVLIHLIGHVCNSKTLRLIEDAHYTALFDWIGLT